MRHGLLASFGACHLQGGRWRTIFVALIATRELRILIWFANVVDRIIICIMKARGLHKLFVLRFFLCAESHTTLRPLCLWVKEREYKIMGSGHSRILYKRIIPERPAWEGNAVHGLPQICLSDSISPWQCTALWVLWSCERALPLLMGEGLSLCKVNSVLWIRRYEWNIPSTSQTLFWVANSYIPFTPYHMTF